MKRLFSRAFLAMFGRPPFLPLATLDEVAEAIHLQDERASTAWPLHCGDCGLRPGGFVKIASASEIDTRRRQARAAASLLGIRLSEDPTPILVIGAPKQVLRCRHNWDDEQCDFPHCSCNRKRPS